MTLEERPHITLGTAAAGWSAAKAEAELANVLADIRRGIWQPPEQDESTDEPKPEPTFHLFASAWLEGRRPELRPRSVEALTWALSGHLLPHLADFLLSDITAEEVDRYKLLKVRERESGLVARPLSNASINKTIGVLAAVLDAAVEYGHAQSNPARGKRRRLKASKPRRGWLELDEVRSILAASSSAQKAMLSTMILAGLRVGETLALRWRDVDLARGRLTVAESKTDAGERVIDLSPDLLSELKRHKLGSYGARPGAFVFPTSTGSQGNRWNVSKRILGRAVKAANVQRAKDGLAPIVGVTNHSLRRTFASLCYEAGASPAYVMSAMGHSSSALALEVYAKTMSRERETGARMDSLVRGVEKAPTGTNGDSASPTFSAAATASGQEAA